MFGTPRTIRSALSAAVLSGRAITPAAALPGECLLQVNGRTVAEGSCHVIYFSGVSFQIEGRWGEASVMVNIDVSSDRAEAYWNGEGRAAHAREPLGTVVRQEECWVNERMRACAWKSRPKPR